MLPRLKEVESACVGGERDGIHSGPRARVWSYAEAARAPGAPGRAWAVLVRSWSGPGPVGEGSAPLRRGGCSLRPRAGDADLEGAFEAARGDIDLPGGGAISQHARFSCVEFGCFPRFRCISGARATSRAAPLFGTASTRPRRPPDFPRAQLAQLEAWI